MLFMLNMSAIVTQHNAKNTLILFWNLNVYGWWGIMTVEGFKECERQQKGFICTIWCNLLVSTISKFIQCRSVAWLQHLCNLLGLFSVLLTFYHDTTAFTLYTTGPDFPFGMWSKGDKLSLFVKINIMSSQMKFCGYSV